MRNYTLRRAEKTRALPFHGWLGLGLVIVFWAFNWLLPGARTHWGFFPLWLGYCLTVDALVYYRKSTSLFSRSWQKYLGLFLLSAPVWWIFEAINWRLQNWFYEGTELFTPLTFNLWATLNFTVVIPAVFGTAELVSSFDFIKRIGKGPIIRPDRKTTLGFFLAGLVMFAVMMFWPKIFFPFAWLSIFFILEPINIWLGNHTLARWTQKGDWRVVIALWLGVLITGFFWEMWNYYSYPKWIYQIPWGDGLRIFEMPLLGYGGYLPFALELYAMYHLVLGLLGQKDPRYLQIAPD